MPHLRILAAAVGAALTWQCGSSPPPRTASLTISGYAYRPADLSVKPGTTITVISHDAESHSVTSQSVADAFVPGAVNGVQFDTGSFHGKATFTIPASAPPGTVVPFFCTVHGQMMGTGRITILDP